MLTASTQPANLSFFLKFIYRALVLLFLGTLTNPANFEAREIIITNGGRISESLGKNVSTLQSTKFYLCYTSIQHLMAIKVRYW